MIKNVLLVLFILLGIQINAQQKDEVLFTIDNSPVYTSEFLRVYNKNKDIVIDNNQKNVDDYFEMFVDFKLKIKEAYDLQLDTAKTFKEELAHYREQLVVPYLSDVEKSDQLTREAYDRTVNEVNVSHILVRVSANASSTDTLSAFKKIEIARNKILNGQSFDEVALEFSEDPSVKQNKGNLGYFSAFDMVYAFENVAYNTPVEEVSKPFRTQFGYHILKVNDYRPSQGEVEVAHIFVKNNPEDISYAKKKIVEYYNIIQQGEDFGFVAKQYSDDKTSSSKNGLLPKFGAGKMIYSIDSTAFALREVGDVSNPFESDYGWHLLKLMNEYPVKDFEALESKLNQQIENGNRSVIIKNSLAQKLEKQYNVVENKEVISEFFETDDLNRIAEEVLFKIEDEHFTVKMAQNYSISSKNISRNEIYNNFKIDKIINYHKVHLEDVNQDFANLLEEYKDGLLLFELLQNNIWEKAEKDSVGMENFYQKNKQNYYWNKRIKLNLATCNRKEKANQVMSLMKEGKSNAEIEEIVNEGATIHVLFKEEVIEEKNSKLPPDFKVEKGISDIYFVDDYHFLVANVLEIIPARLKELDETRGQVLNDYQIYLEKQWIEGLHDKYDVKVNNRAMKHLRKNLDK